MSPLSRVIGRLVSLLGLPLMFHWSLGKEYSPYIDCGTVMREKWQR